MKFEEILDAIRVKYEDLDKIREEVLVLHRKIIRECSEVIKKIHRHEWEQIQDHLDHLKGKLGELRDQMKPLLEVDVSNYLITPEQEYCEAAMLWTCVREQSFPSPQELAISPLSYLLGLADTVGELRRLCLDSIRAGHVDQAVRSFRQMETILDGLFSFDFPKGLLPRLRSKVDSARNIVNRTRADITLAVQSHELNENLKKYMHSEEK